MGAYSASRIVIEIQRETFIKYLQKRHSGGSPKDGLISSENLF
jgi:hypothetical protein